MESKRLLWIGVINIGVIVLGITLYAIIGHMSFLSVAVTIVAIATFFGALTGSEAPSDQLLFRRAITLAVVTVYLVLVSIVAFFKEKWESPEVTNTLLASFTSITGVIVAFYFGSSSYLDYLKAKRSSNSKDQAKGHDGNA